MEETWLRRAWILGCVRPRLHDIRNLFTLRARTCAVRRPHAYDCSPTVGTLGGVALRVSRCAVGVVALAAFAACSSDNAPPQESAVESGPSNVVASSTTVTIPTTTSSPSPTTAEMVSTVLPTTSVSPPAPTISPAESAESAVRTAIGLAQDSFSACLVAMPACDPATLAVARAGDLLERNVSRIEEWNAAGYTVRDRDRFRYVVESVELSADVTSAVVTVCIADGSRLVVPQAGPAGEDVIVDDEFISGRSMWDMRLDSDGVWRGYDAPALGPTEPSDVCPPA